jgi:predicted DNA-binding transcriptional regulator AlpA
MKAANDNQRLLTRQQAAEYCGCSVATFSGWVSAGHMPKPLFGSRRWDKKAIDIALDKASGLTLTAAANDNEDPLDKWLREIKCA